LFGQTIQIDSLIRILPKQNDSVKVLIFTELAWLLRNIEVDDAIEYGIRGEKIAKINNYITLQPKILNLIGVGFRNKGNYAEALKYFIATIDIANKTGNQEQLAYAYQNIGDISNRNGNYKAAETDIFKALDIFNYSNDVRGLAYCYYSLGLVYTNKQEYVIATKYFLKSLEIRQQLKDDMAVAACYSQLAFVEQKQKKYEKALVFFRKAKKIFQAKNDLRGIILLDYNISTNYLIAKDHHRALLVMEEALENAEKSGNLEYIKQCYQQFAKIYADTKNYEKAYSYQNKYLFYGDSLFNEQKNKQLLELREKFDDEKRQIEIEALTDKTKQQNIFVVLLVFLLIALAFVTIYTYQVSQKQKESNIILETQSKKIQEQNISLLQLNQDILQRNEVVENQNHTLKYLSQIQNKLFSIISHDFKNPLISLYGSLFIFASTDFSEEDKKMAIETLKSELEQTSNLLDNLLHWSLAQMKEDVKNTVRFNFLEVVKETIVLLKPQADKKQIKIIYPQTIPPDVYADREMLQIVLRNLLHNAIKFSYTNSSIFISILPTTHNVNTITVTVKDFGKGISRKNQEKLFQVDNSSSIGTAQEKGSGFGLLLCKDFVEKNGGQIWVHSEIDQGASFYFTIPIAK
jgi:signal transduction histidine kinase